MQGKGLARFFELRGWQIAEGAGAYWLRLPGRYYMSMPNQLIFDPDPGEINAMLRSIGGVGVRYPSRNRGGVPGGVYVCRDTQYDLARVHPKQRAGIRRGLERCEIRPVTESELLSEGLQLNLDTMERQKRREEEFADPGRWARFVEAVRQSPTVEVVGAFVGGRLSAYTVNCREDRWLHIVYQMSRTEDLGSFPNHALTYQVTMQASKDPEVDAVCYGPVSVVATEGLHQYKTRMGYEVIPYNLAVQLHPFLSPILTSAPTNNFLKWMRKMRPQDARLERVASILEGARLSRGKQEAGVAAGRAWPDLARPVSAGPGHLVDHDSKAET